MSVYDYLIIGGGVAGTTAAETIRRNDSSGTIAILEDEEHPLYSRVFLPAYSRGEFAREKVMLRTLGDYERQNIDIYLSKAATRIDFLRREVFTPGGRVFAYKKLLLASGGRVRSWQFEEEFGERILRLQTLEDAERIRGLGAGMKNVAVVGGGFIALEFLNIFKKYGAQISLIFPEQHFWEGRVEEQGRDFFKELFSRHGVEAFPGDEIYEIKRTGSTLQILTKNGHKIAADYIGAGLGLKRNYVLASGVLELGEGIRVNEFLEARGGEAVWAAGDVAEYFDKFSGRWRTCGNWTHGFLTGFVAGGNMAGARREFSSVPTYSIKCLDSVLTFLGEVDEKFADETQVQTALAERKYSRFFLKEGRLSGAVLINTYQLKPRLAKLIEAGEKFDLKKL